MATDTSGTLHRKGTIVVERIQGLDLMMAVMPDSSARFYTNKQSVVRLARRLAMALDWSGAK